MLLAKYNKQPAEVKRYVISFAKFLSSSELILTSPLPVGTVRLLNPASDTDPEIASPTLSVSNITVVNNQTEVGYFIAGGTDGKRYQVTITSYTDQSQVVESEIEFRVVEI
jgi:hypothetical protein